MKNLIKFFRVGAMAAIICLLTMGAARAFDQKDLEQLQEHNRCPECDLRDADLSGADLAMADLSFANLFGADLSRADLTWAELSGADLSKADLSEAIWIDGRKCAERPIGECYLYYPEEIYR